jgi:hypothetical protein
MTQQLLAFVFLLSNLLLVPIYVLMVLLPRAAISRRVMQSPWSVAAPALLTTIFGLGFMASDEEARKRYLPTWYPTRAFRGD